MLETLTPESLKKAVTLVDNHGVTIHLLRQHRGIHIRTVLRAGNHEAACLIEQTHDNIVSLTLDGKAAEDRPVSSENLPFDRFDRAGFDNWLRDLTLEEMLGMIHTFDDDDIEFIKKGVDLNYRPGGTRPVT